MTADISLMTVAKENEKWEDSRTMILYAVAVYKVKACIGTR